MSDLLNILSNSNKDIDNQKLMDYLSGKLSAEDHHDVEKWMLENEFATEAVEGLEKMERKQNVNLYVDQLNKQLSQYLTEKKKRRNRKSTPEIPWTMLAILLILVLIVCAYFVIKSLGN